MHKLLQDELQTVRDKNEVTNDPGLRDRRASRKLFDTLLRLSRASFSFSLFLSQILSWRERARELPRLHLAASGPHYEIKTVMQLIGNLVSTTGSRRKFCWRTGIESTLISTIGDWRDSAFR